MTNIDQMDLEEAQGKFSEEDRDYSREYGDYLDSLYSESMVDEVIAREMRKDF